VIQITPQMRVVVAVEPADFRKRIDGLARLCQEALEHDPFSGWVFVFRNRKATAVKLLICDGQGFWLCYKRLEAGTFEMTPGDGPYVEIDATQLAMLLGPAEEQLGDCPDFPAGKMGLSPSQTGKLFVVGPLGGVSLVSVKRRKR